MKQSDSIAKLAAALVKAHRELRPIAKDSINPHFKSKFASLDAIMVDVRPIMASHGLAVVQGATTPHTNEAGIVTAFTVETLLVHESGEWICSSVVMPIIKADPQGAGAAVTYGRRYGISALLGLSTDEDDDGNSASQRSGAGVGRAAQRSTAGVGQMAASELKAPATAQASPQKSAPPRTTGIDQSKQLPFGKSKGAFLSDVKTDDLVGAVKWARENKPDQYAVFIEAAELVIEDKSLAGV